MTLDLSDDLDAIARSLPKPRRPPGYSQLWQLENPAAAGARGGGGPQEPATAEQMMAQLGAQPYGQVGIGSVDDGITGDQIGDDEISARHIVAGSLTTEHIDVSDFTVTELENEGSSVVIDPDGIVITRGALTFVDDFGVTVLTGLGFGASWLDFVLDMVYNSGFGAAPAGGNGSTINNAGNPMPSWERVNISGTAITPTWEQDSSVPSRGRVQLDMVAGAAGDDLCFEQYVHIPQQATRAYAYRVIATIRRESGGPVPEVYLRTQLYTKALATIGTADARVVPCGDIALGALADLVIDVNGNNGHPPATAYYVRIRMGLARGAAATSAVATVSLLGVRVVDGDGNQLVADLEAPGTYGAGEIDQRSGILKIRPDVSITDEPNIQLNASSGNIRLGIERVGSKIIAEGPVDLRWGVQLGFSNTYNISSNLTNWDPTDGQDYVIWCVIPDASRNINGIVSHWGDGEIKIIRNRHGTATLTLIHNATSDLANRIFCPNVADYVIRPRGSAVLIYDGNDQRWYVSATA